MSLHLGVLPDGATSSCHPRWSRASALGPAEWGTTDSVSCRRGCIQHPSVLTQTRAPLPSGLGSSAPCLGPIPSVTSQPPLPSPPGGSEGAPGPGPRAEQEALLPERGPGRVPGRGLRVCRSGPAEGRGALRLLKGWSLPIWGPAQHAPGWPGPGDRALWQDLGPWTGRSVWGCKEVDSPADGRLWGPSLPTRAPALAAPGLTQDFAPAPWKPHPPPVYPLV